MEQKLEQIFGSYMAWKMDEMTWVISFMNGTEYMYLLEGEEKALLLDTGYGAGNLRAFIEKLTNKPVMVANTHFHPDHAGGNGEFERVYMSKGAVVDAPSTESEGAVPFDLNKLPHPDYEKIFIEEGYLFELGGRSVEVVDVKPAHCNSSLFFLDRGHRMLFCGDDFESAQVLMYDNSKNSAAPYEVGERLANFKANGERVRDLGEAYDFLMPNHNGTPIAKSYVQDYIDLVDAIWDGTAVIEDWLNHPFIEMDPIAAKLCRVRCGKASIFIEKAEVMKVYGKAHNKG